MAYFKLLTLGFAGLLLSGCGQSAKQGELDKSLATWQDLKAQNGDHYRYKTRFTSFTGFGSTTTLTVKDGQVVVRTYESYTTDNGGERESGDSWTEEGAAVGSHEAGAEPRTVDELYMECREDVLIKNAAENEFYLEFRDDEVLATCQYRPLECVDDCLFGVSIDSLEFLSTKPD